MLVVISTQRDIVSLLLIVEPAEPACKCPILNLPLGDVADKLLSVGIYFQFLDSGLDHDWLMGRGQVIVVIVGYKLQQKPISRRECHLKSIITMCIFDETGT